ncbi:MAG: NADH-quinone oxidoreductase subunit NuoE [Phycisphaerae bacterium]
MSNTAKTDNWQQVKQTAEEALTPEIVSRIDQAMRTPNPESHLISVLHKVQEHFGYLGTDQLDAVAQLLQVPASTVSGVATFYHFFRLTPKGKHTISICMGTACYVKGAAAVAERFYEELGIENGETTTDGQFTLAGTRCLGTCGLAPVVMIDEDVHGGVRPDQVPLLLDKYRD